MRKLFRSVFAVVSAVLFFAAVPAAAKTFHVFVLTGQSNSLGAIKGNFADAEKMRPAPSEIPLAGARVVALRENLLRDLRALRVDGLKRISAARTALLVGEPANFFGKEKRATDGGTSAENLKTAARSVPLAAWIPTRDLPKIAFGDNLGVHYDGNAQLVIGARFAEAFAALRETSER